MRWCGSDGVGRLVTTGIDLVWILTAGLPCKLVVDGMGKKYVDGGLDSVGGGVGRVVDGLWSEWCLGVADSVGGVCRRV